MASPGENLTTGIALLYSTGGNTHCLEHETQLASFVDPGDIFALSTANPSLVGEDCASCSWAVLLNLEVLELVALGKVTEYQTM
ncbi:hypothetical protein GCM10025794_31320 [Massilia kyonggiensis]